jgi:hypothetical protein
LAGDLNGEHAFWNSEVSNPSGKKLMALFNLSKFKISASQCPTPYSPAGNGNVLNTVVHQNIIVSDVTDSDILDPDHLPILFHTLDHAKFTNLLEHIEKFTDWAQFQSLTS